MHIYLLSVYLSCILNLLIWWYKKNLIACLKHLLMAKYVKSVFYFWFNSSLGIHIYISFLRVWWSLPKVIEPAVKFLWYSALKSKVLAVRNYFCQSKLSDPDMTRRASQEKAPNLWAVITTLLAVQFLLPCAVRYEPLAFVCGFLIMLVIRSGIKLHRTCCGTSSLFTQLDEYFAVLSTKELLRFSLISGAAT